MVFPNITDQNVSSIVDIIKYDNVITQGVFIPAILLTLWAMAFGAMFFVDKSKSFMTSTFFIFILSAPLWAAGLPPLWYSIMLGIAMVINAAYLVYTMI